MTTTTMTYAALSSFPPSRPSLAPISTSYASHHAAAPSLDIDLLASLSTFPAPPSHIPASPNTSANPRFPPSPCATGPDAGSRRPSDGLLRKKESSSSLRRTPVANASGPGLPPTGPLPPLPPPSSSDAPASLSLSASTPGRPPSSVSHRQASNCHDQQAKIKPSPLSLSQPPSAYSDISELPYVKKRSVSHSASASVSSTRSFDAPSVSACGSTSSGSSDTNSRQNSLYRASSSSQLNGYQSVSSNGQLYTNAPLSPTFSVRSGISLRSTVSVAESLRNRLAEFTSTNPISAPAPADSSLASFSGTGNVVNLAGIGTYGARRASAQSGMTFGGAAGVEGGRLSIGSRGSGNSRGSLASFTSKGSGSSAGGKLVSAYMREDHFSEESDVDGDCDEFGVERKRKSGGSKYAVDDDSLEKEMEALEESLLSAPMPSGLASLSPSPSPSPIPPPLSLRIPKTDSGKDKVGKRTDIQKPERGDDEVSTRTPTLSSSTSSATLNSAIADAEIRTPIDGAPLMMESRPRRDFRAKFGLGIRDSQEKPLPSVPPFVIESDHVMELEVQRPKFEMAVCGPSPVRAEYNNSEKNCMPKETLDVEREESEDGDDDFDFPMPPSSVPAVPMATPVRPSVMKRLPARERSNTTTSNISARSTASVASGSKVQQGGDERRSRATNRDARDGTSSPELDEMIQRAALNTPRAKSKSKSRSRAASRVRSKKSFMSEESLLFGSEPFLNDESGSGSGSSRGHGGDQYSGGKDWDSEEGLDEVDSDLDIHTPLPHILLREGVLSPHSRVLVSSNSAPNSRPASVLTVGSDVSQLSVTTKSGVVLMRDTEVRKVRHRDGRTLREGLGLTTGLGWSDSEDDDVDVEIWTSSPGVSRQASMASLSSFRSGRSFVSTQRKTMSRSSSSSALQTKPSFLSQTPHSAPPSSFGLNKRSKTPVSARNSTVRSVSSGQLGRTSSIASSVASSTCTGRERESLLSSASGSSGESYGSRITTSSSSVLKGFYSSSTGSSLSRSTSAAPSSTCVRTPVSMPRKQHTVPACAPRPGLSHSVSYGAPSQPRTASAQSQPPIEAQKSLPRMASMGALNSLRSQTKAPSRSVGFGRVGREQAVRGTISRPALPVKK